MQEYVLTPLSDLQNMADTVRKATGSTGTFSVSGLSSAVKTTIESGTGGGGSAEGCVTVTFMNGAEVLFTRPVYIGDDCPDPVTQGHITTTPTKESTVQYDYTYIGWAATDNGAADSNVLKNITADKTIYAAYAASVRYYTVTYYDEDGVTVLHTEQLAYGTTPSYVPTKEGYGFGGWTSEPSPVTGDTSYSVASWLSVVGSGSCGDAAYWSLDSNGLLTVSGSGTVSKGQWSSAASDAGISITEIVVEEGITVISENTFSYLTKTTRITLPSTITASKSEAFYYCPALTHVYISDLAAWLSIDFYNASSHPIQSTEGAASLYLNGNLLEEVVIPQSITSISTWEFRWWKWLKSVTFHKGVTSIGVNAFDYCTSLTSAVFEDTEGWTAGSTAIASADLADTATAATYLKTTYRINAWTKS